jgi:hypothetical protein
VRIGLSDSPPFQNPFCSQPLHHQIRIGTLHLFVLSKHFTLPAFFGPLKLGETFCKDFFLQKKEYSIGVAIGPFQEIQPGFEKMQIEW